MNCPNCGGAVPPNVNRCVKCGSYVEQTIAPPVMPPPTQMPGVGFPPAVDMTPQKSRLVAGLLGIFLGGLGVHRFYLGDIGIGLAQLLISLVGGSLTCGILAIPVVLWGITEGVLILVGVIKRDGEGRDLTA
jgi:TM2 domain-containing membrane protein YozV